MRTRIAESRYTFSINLPIPLYKKVLDKAGRGRVSTFIKEVLEKELNGEEEQFKQRLILAHKRATKNQRLKKDLAVWDETVDDYINKEDEKN